MENMQETDAEQPTTQSRSQCSSSDDYMLITERKWADVTANEYSHNYLTFGEICHVMKIAETVRQMEQLVGDWYVRN